MVILDQMCMEIIIQQERPLGQQKTPPANKLSYYGVVFRLISSSIDVANICIIADMHPRHGLNLALTFQGQSQMSNVKVPLDFPYMFSY